MRSHTDGVTPHITPDTSGAHGASEQASAGTGTDAEGNRGLHSRPQSEHPHAGDHAMLHRVADLADLIITRTEHGVWTRSSYPSAEQMAAELDAPRELVAAAVDVLRWRRLLFDQSQPGTGTRLLPDPDLSSRNAPRHVADRIAIRIKLGVWDGDHFPGITTIVAQFASSLNTVTSAMQLLKSEGLVHKIVVDSGASGRGSRRQAWRPTSVADQGLRDLTPALREAIRAGSVGPIMPTKVETAERYRVPHGVAADAYHRLQTEGILSLGWLPGGKKPVWYVTNASDLPPDLLPGEVRSIALAARLLKDIPDRLVQHRNGTWYRRPLPTQRELADTYHVHAFNVERAQELLVLLNVLERAPVAHRVYFPRPPASPAQAHGLSFRTINKPPPRPWVPARETAEWLPLPTSADDENVQRVDALAPRLTRRKKDRH